eukprot:TRINITY_DN9285_c0_g1_i4.p1 TRINITY_DN9285_c0_g1~~TRINITY_DN9285_c0_g1_i4.p1  ORF type:complete len:874 (+),score=226.91 TRINITY_DN9285_c0_g1_i4:141-2762(+)
MAEDNADKTLVIEGRIGHADFINGHYDLQNKSLNGKPVFKSQNTVPDGYDKAEGSSVYLYFHADNDAWVISHKVKSLDVIAFAPSHIKNIWHVANGEGAFVPDPTVKLVAASNGEVLTRLGPWTIEADGEVALKMESEGEGAEQPLTVLEMLDGIAQRFGDEIALCSLLPNGSWNKRTYRAYLDEAQLTAMAFVKLGLQPFHSVLVMSTNTAEANIATLGAILAGGVATSAFETATDEDVHFIADSTNADIIVVDSDDALSQIIRIKSRLPKLRAVVQSQGTPNSNQAGNLQLLSWVDMLSTARDIPEENPTAQELYDRQADLRANKCAVIVHTPGNSEDPKSVMLSHDNVTWTARSLSKSLGAKPGQDKVVSMLPFASAAAQMFELWLPMACVATVYFGQQQPLYKFKVLSTLRNVKPTLFLGTPWIFERLMELSKDTKKLTAKIARTGVIGSLREQRGEELPRNFKATEKKVFSKFKDAIGMSESRLIFSYDSNLPPHLAEYFLSINLPIYEAYGCAESAGFHTLSLPTLSRAASAGKCFPGAQVRMVHGTHEILMFGRHVFMGYLHDADKTSDAIDERGWFHTKDIGQADRSAYLYVTGRQKDLVRMASGASVPPAAIEDTFMRDMDGLFAHAVLVGHKRKALSLLLVPKTRLDAEYNPTKDLDTSAIEYLKSKSCLATTVQHCIEGAHAQRVHELIQQAIDATNARAISDIQKIENFEILSRGFSRSTGELAPTYKLRRHFILHRYASVIDRLYNNEAVEDFEAEEWYHGPIGRADVARLLKRDRGGWDGWFLIRQSTKEADTFVISVCVKGKLFHNQIKYVNGMYNTHKDQGNHQYQTLGELIKHHREGKHGFQVKLKKHCKAVKKTG